MWQGTPKTSGLGALGVGAFFGVFFGACMTDWVAIVRRRDRAVTGSLSRSDRVELNRAARAGSIVRHGQGSHQRTRHWIRRLWP
jgi:hypothetical protein